MKHQHNNVLSGYGHIKKVWIWNHYATEMYRNSGGRHYWFARNLITRGYEVTVFCANTYHNKTEFIDTGKRKFKLEAADNVPFLFVKTKPAVGNGFDRFKNILYFFKNLLGASKSYCKRSGKPDVILASSVHPLTMVAGILISKRLKVPCICEIRDLWPEAIFSFHMLKEKSLIGKILCAGEHWIYKRADALIFTKEGDVDYIKEKKWDIYHGGNIDLNKCHYINNGVDLEVFQKAKNEFVLEDEDLANSKFHVVYTGAIRPVNHVDGILDAAALLKDVTDIQFLIYGEGNQSPDLKERIAREDLFNVKMKGYVDKKYIPYILSKSSINLLNYSSTQYNWARGNSSNKLFEYMASGKPIISTVKMGYCIIEKYHAGLSLENSTAEEFAQAILKIYHMPKEQYDVMGANAMNGARDFDCNILTDRLEAVFRSLE